MLIRSALYRAEKPSEPFGKAEVYVHYYFGDNRRRDPDNYSGKMLLDPLVSEGVLKDDSFRVIRLFLSAETDKKRPRTEIIVNEIE